MLREKELFATFQRRAAVPVNAPLYASALVFSFHYAAAVAGIWVDFFCVLLWYSRIAANRNASPMTR
jgi:hypothetical protein